MQLVSLHVWILRDMIVFIFSVVQYQHDMHDLIPSNVEGICCAQLDPFTVEGIYCAQLDSFYSKWI